MNNPKSPSQALLSGDEKGFSFFLSLEKLGVRRLSPVLDIDEHPASFTFDAPRSGPDGMHIQGTDANDLIRWETILEPLTPTRACLVRHRLVNQSRKRPLRITNVQSAQRNPGDGLQLGGGKDWDLRFCHTDNLRIERYPHCQMDSPYVRVLPTSPRTLGLGEDQPFPGLYVTDRNYRRGIVLGALSQKINFQSYTLQRAATPGESIFERFAIHHEFPLSRGITLEPGEAMDLDGIYIQILEGTHPEDAFEEFLAHLASRHSFRGAKSSMLKEGLYCSWNYGRFSEQHEANLLPTAHAIAEKFPSLRYFLIDAGYTRGCEGIWGGLEHNFNDSFYPDPEKAVDPKRFPRGMKAFADRLRSLGLKPGIWWSPMCRLDTALYTEHPDWFLRTVEGEIYQIAEDRGFLDLSIPAALDFVDHVLSVILGDWKMEALKMDFWSHQFEDRCIRLARPNTTSAQTRTLLFELVRKYLPEDGVFMTCCATGMGNPFLAEQVDTFRNTIDIGAGVWNEQIHTAYWALPALGRAGRQSYLHNNDSVGIETEYPENENYFRLTWCFITMGIQEVAGFLEKLPEQYLRPLQKFSENCERGYRCLCPDEKAWRGEPLPEVLYVDYPEGSKYRQKGVLKHVALFNWSDESQMVGSSQIRLQLPAICRIRNFWTEEAQTFGEEGIFEFLPARTARLYEITQDA